MKKTILTDALGSCASLKDFVSAILRTDAYIRWKLVSASCEGESCRAEFVSPCRGAGPRVLPHRRERASWVPFSYFDPPSR